MNTRLPRLRPAVSKPALLCVVPPYTIGPPAGMAYLLGYAKQQGCTDFGFLDLRLGVPDAYAPTYAPTGTFGESYVMDIPDLPLVLSVVAAFEAGAADPTERFPAVLEKYCRERHLSPAYLGEYLATMNRYLRTAAEAVSGVRVVGCSVWTSNYLTTLLFAAHLKRLPKPPIVIGGGPQLTESHASTAIGIRGGLFDYVVSGEGEVTLLDLYGRLSGNGACTGLDVPGTITRAADGSIHRAADRLQLLGGAIGVPAFDQIPLLSYQQVGYERSVPYHLSRGCTDKCTFCSEWVFWKRFRPADVESTLRGIRELERNYGARHIAFTDSLLNGHPGRLLGFAEGMLRRRPRMSWSGFMRADITLDTAKLLRRAGCNSVFVGIESMSDETLALMNKRRTEAQNIAALRAFLTAEIQVVAGLIPGFPGDSRAAFIHTVEQLRALQSEFRGRLRVNVEPFIVSPNQPMFAKLESVGLTKVGWSDDVLDIAPRFRDITSTVVCAVEGANQGLERMGRLRIAEAVQDDAARYDTFEYKSVEDLSPAEFSFHHLTGGWFLARTKGPAAWIYALIVSDEERRDLEETLGADIVLNALSARGMNRCLKRLERAHLIPPRQTPLLLRGGYDRTPEGRCTFRATPYIVARQSDWRVHRQTIVSDINNGTFWCRPQWHGVALKLLHRSPHDAESLHCALARAGVAKSARHCEALLLDLAEEGLVLIERSAPAT